MLHAHVTLRWRLLMPPHCICWPVRLPQLPRHPASVCLSGYRNRYNAAGVDLAYWSIDGDSPLGSARTNVLVVYKGASMDSDMGVTGEERWRGAMVVMAVPYACVTTAPSCPWGFTLSRDPVSHIP